MLNVHELSGYPSYSIIIHGFVHVILPGVVFWIIFMHNFSEYSISCISNDPSNLLSIPFCLSHRILPVILDNFLHANVLAVLVMK